MIFLPFPSLHLEQFIVTQEGITALVRVTAESADCPDCQRSSSRVHSHYQRTLKDLPASGLSVHLKLQVRRFFCDNPFCARKTFAQAVPEVTTRYARKTLRLIDILTQLGFALGGEAGAHIATVLQMTCSADTFLRLIRKTSLAAHPTPTHLGVDDWAFHRNVSYGTILVDLQDHRVVDLLPDRAASSLESWLTSHPGVHLISRDRSGDYAIGARKGAPQAVQVADRFHLQKNLGEVVERIFRRHQDALQHIKVAPSSSVAIPIPRQEQQGQKAITRTRRIQRYEAVRQLYLQGITLSEIARRLHMGRMTVQKFAYAETYPETAPYRIQAGCSTPTRAICASVGNRDVAMALNCTGRLLRWGIRANVSKSPGWLPICANKPKQESLISP